MLLNKILAHSEDLHDETTSDFVHIITDMPLALVLYICGLLLLWAILKKYNKAYHWLIIASLFYNFIIGVLAFALVPWVSVIAFTLGIATALVFTLGSLAS